MAANFGHRSGGERAAGGVGGSPGHNPSGFSADRRWYAAFGAAEFLCGVFGPNGQTKDSAVFVLPNLPPGKYAVTILDVSGGKTPLTLTFVLQEIGGDWKLAGFFAADLQVAGHDAAWFLQRAHDFEAKSQKHNAWLYHREAIALSVPINFMSTRATDKLYEDAQAMQPLGRAREWKRGRSQLRRQNLPFDRHFSPARGQ